MKQTIYALGFFDGVHLGHQALLAQCRRMAEAAGMEPGVVTFQNHPDALVLGSAPPLINTPADRERLLRPHVSRVVTLPFHRQMLETPWQAFLDMLCRDYGAGGFVCGDDFRFGSRGEGTGQSLTRYCAARGLPCAVVPEQTVEGVRISSTHIRTLLEAGSMAQSLRFLGHPHILTGTVVHGQQLGRTLGIPTANLPYPQGIALLRRGVYATRVLLDGAYHTGVTNVGVRPTVGGGTLNAETWLLGYCGDLYGRELTLEFHSFLRPEQKFATLSDMQSEIRRNARQAEALFPR